VTSLALASLVASLGCGSKGKHPAEPVEVVAKEPESPIELGQELDSLARELTLRGKLETGQAASSWHFRATRKEGRVVLVERVSPAGLVTDTYTVEQSPTAQTVTMRNGYGEIVRTDVLSKDGSFVRTQRSGRRELEGCVRASLTWDDAGRATSRRCLDREGKGMIDEEGCDERRRAYDARGFVTDDRCFVSGAPALRAGGGHALRHERDERGLVVATSRLDLEGKLVAGQSGCARELSTWSAAANLLRTQCLATDGAPATKTDGTAAERRAYDDRGCLVRQQHLDARGEVAERDEIAELAWERDAYCTVLRVEHRRADGSLASPKLGASIEENELDARGRVAKKRCRGTDRRPAKCQNGAAGDEGSLLTYEYDDKSRLVARKSFDSLGRPARRSHDYPHGERNEYDDQGLVRATVWFDDAGAPAPAFDGAMKKTLDYDARGLWIASKYFGPDDRPLGTTTNCHETTAKRDASGRLLEHECKGPDGKLARANLCLSGICWPAGAARVEIRRSEGLRNLYFDVDGNLVQDVDCRAAKCFGR
jgi:hypothetical protein